MPRLLSIIKSAAGTRGRQDVQISDHTKYRNWISGLCAMKDFTKTTEVKSYDDLLKLKENYQSINTK